LNSTTDFIAELVRAANEIEKLDPTEARRLLNRAVNTIRYMREEVSASLGQGATSRNGGVGNTSAQAGEAGCVSGLRKW
jgi:hypothetical protein